MSAALAAAVVLVSLGAATTVWLVFRAALRAAPRPDDARSQEDELLALRAEQLAALPRNDPEARALREDLERVLVAETAPEALRPEARRPEVRRGAVAASDRRIMGLTLLLVPALALGTWLIQGGWPGLGLRAAVVELENAEAGEAHDADAVAELVRALEARLEEGTATPDERFLLGRALLVRQAWDRAERVLRSLRESVGEAPVLDSLWLQAAFRAGAPPPAPGTPPVPDGTANVQGRLPGVARTYARAMDEDHPALAVGLELLALDAMSRGDLPDAAVHLQRLLERVEGTPREASIRAGLDRIAQTLGALPEVPGAPATAPGAPDEAGARIRVRVAVELAPGYAPAADATVFVFARALSGGPPLAARRLAAGELPTRLELTDEDAMIPGRSLSSADGFEVVARLSSDGSPQGRPGDPVARSGALDGEPPEPITLRLGPSSPGAGP